MLDLINFERWLDAKGRSGATRAAYVRAVTLVGSLDPATVAAYFSARSRDSASTLRVTQAALRAYAAWSKVPDPTADIPLRRPKATLPRPMPMADVERLFKEPDLSTPEGLRDRVMLELMLHGLRRHEVGTLTTDDVHVGDGIALRFAGKGGDEAEIMVNHHSALLLARHILGKEPDASYDRHGPEGRWFRCLEDTLRRLKTRPLFTLGSGPVNDRWVNRMFAKYRERAGLSRKWGPHSLRHTCGTELVERQVDIRVVQDVLRHKDIRMTMRYTKVSRGAKARAADQIPIPKC